MGTIKVSEFDVEELVLGMFDLDDDEEILIREEGGGTPGKICRVGKQAYTGEMFFDLCARGQVGGQVSE